MKYEINKLTDILNVDEKHIDELLTDLKDYYDFFRPLVKQGVGKPKELLIFTPDGKRAHSIKVTEKGVSLESRENV